MLSKNLKRIIAAIACMLLMGTLFGCGKVGLPEGFDSTKVLEIAKDAVEDIAEGDYEDVSEEFSKEMKAILGEKGLREALAPQMKKLGEFQSFTSETVTGKEDTYAGDYATVILECKFSGGTATFTISVDRNDKICELYMK